MTVGLIWAQAANGVIGARERLPWDLPEDLARFRALTLRSSVVMGRRTWQALPDKVRPLPGRRNVVLSRRSGWRAPGATVVDSLDAALEATSGDVWVIGGAEVYRRRWSVPIEQRSRVWSTASTATCSLRASLRSGS